MLRHIPTLLLVSALAGCQSSPGKGQADVLSDGDLRLDEHALTARVDGAVLQLSVAVQNIGAEAAGTLAVRLIDLGGDADEVKGEVSRTVTVAHGTGRHEIEVPGLSGGLATGDLGRFVFDIRINAGAAELHVRRSVYQTVARLSAHLLAPDTFSVTGSGNARVFVRQAGSNTPVATARVRATLVRGEEHVALGEASTDATGLAVLEMDFANRSAGTGELVISVDHAEGQAQLRAGIQLVDALRVQLTTDKPKYQPGQDIHLRALALRAGNRLPAANTDAHFEIYDGKGNRVHREQVTTNRFGLVSTRFRLATRVNEGSYRLVVGVGDASVERSVLVTRYQLPRFRIDWQSDSTWARPGDVLSANLTVKYPFGEAVRNAQVDVQVARRDSNGEALVNVVSGSTDAQGKHSFSVPLPGSFSADDLRAGKAGVRLAITVTDGAGQKESIERSLLIANGALRVQLIPHQQPMITDVPQPATLVVTDPFGAPATGVRLNLTAERFAGETVVTDADGLASVAGLFAETLQIEARTENGEVVVETFQPEANKGVLIESESPLLSAGSTATLNVRSGSVGTLLYDVRQAGRSLLAGETELADGHARLTLELPADVHGGVTFGATLRTADGDVLRGQRLLYVDGRKDLNVAIAADKTVYRPGEIANLALTVTDEQGEGHPSAVSLTAVDEAVFASSSSRPGVDRATFDLGSDRSEAPRVLQPANVLAASDPIRRARLAAPAFAVLDSVSTGINQNSATLDHHTMKTHVSARVNRELAAVGEILRIQFESEGLTQQTYPIYANALLRDRFDPFGKAYRHQVNDWSIELSSAGPDERFATDDDAVARLHAHQFMGFMTEMDDANAGGGPPPAGGQPERNNPAEEGDGATATKVRSWFPETLIVEPALITDDDGTVDLAVRMADSITTWRLAAQAVGATGHLGATSQGLVVFQPFFIDLDLPTQLTRGDEVNVPAIVYNYLETPQTVSLRLVPDPSITLIGAAEQQLTLDPGEVRSVQYVVRADAVGHHQLQLEGNAGDESDAVQRSVRVAPDGDAVVINRGGSLAAGETTLAIDLPASGVEGADEVFVKIYPGFATQVVEGMGSMIRMPSGCFEQTTSTAWPNILAMQYMMATDTLDPELALQARETIAAGYQRILTFESPTGGYNWWGNADPGNRILTAIALMQFADLRGIHETDPAVAERHRNWLVEQQDTNGTWAAGDALHAGNEALGEDILRSTAFIAWGLAKDGGAPDAVSRAMTFIANTAETTDDLYAIAVAANALAVAEADHPSLPGLLDRLAADAQQTGSNASKWSFGGASWTGASGGGTPGEVEMTGLVVNAFIRTGQHSDLAERGLNFLAGSKDAFGNWYSTQATVNSLRALTAAAQGASQPATATVRIKHGGAVVRTLEITPDNSDLHHQIDLSQRVVRGGDSIALELVGEGTFLYQVISRHFEPWSAPPQQVGNLGLAVSYDRTDTAVGGMIELTAAVTNRVSGSTMDQVIVSVGRPPGFTLVRGDLQNLVDQELVARFESDARQLTFYLMGLRAEQPRRLTFRMQAERPVNAQAPPSRAYSYYEPEEDASTGAVAVTVTP
jgi:alpha-2-macroglobulin-like protein